MYFTYLFRCNDGSLYCGITNDLKSREKMHNDGKGSMYVRSRGGGRVVYFEEFITRNEALRREISIKKLTKIKKEYLIKYKL